jgi:hypothetical protein
MPIASRYLSYCMSPKQVAGYARVMRAEGIESLEVDGCRIRLAPASAQAPAATAPSARTQPALTPAEQKEARDAETKRLTYAHTAGAPTR